MTPNQAEHSSQLMQDPLDLAELHSFRLVYFKHKEIFLVFCIVSRWEYRVTQCPLALIGLTLSGPLLQSLLTGFDQIKAVLVGLLYNAFSYTIWLLQEDDNT